MDKFKIKLLEQQLYTNQPIGMALLDEAMLLFITERTLAWSGTRIHMSFKMPNGRNLRLARLLLPHIPDDNSITARMRLFKYRMQKFL